MSYRNNCNCRVHSSICPAWKRIRRDSVLQMYLEGERIKNICAHWGLGHAASVLNLVGRDNIRHSPGLQKGIRALNAAGIVVHKFFPIRSCEESGFNATCVSKSLRTGKPYRSLVWELFP